MAEDIRMVYNITPLKGVETLDGILKECLHFGILKLKKGISELN